MRRFGLLLIVVGFSLQGMAQTSLSFQSDESLFLGTVVNRFSLLPQRDCPVDQISFSPSSIESYGQFGQPIQVEQMKDFVRVTKELNYSSLEKIRQWRPEQNDSRRVRFRYRGGVQGPNYEILDLKNCEYDRDLEAVVTAIKLRVLFEVTVDLIFADAVEKNKVLYQQELTQSNLFSLFFKLRQSPNPPRQVIISFKQRGGDSSMFNAFVEKNMSDYSRCHDEDFRACQQLISSIYSYVFEDRGLHDQLWQAHQESEDTFSSRSLFTMQGETLEDDHYLRKQEAVKTVMLQLLEQIEKEERLKSRGFQFEQELVNKTLEDLDYNIGKMDRHIEYCFELWESCQLNGGELSQHMIPITDETWRTIDFQAACQWESETLFYQNLFHEYSMNGCKELEEFLMTLKTLEAHDLGQWVVYPLRFFPNIEVLDLRGTRILSLDGLESLPRLKRLYLEPNHGLNYFWLQVVHPDLVVIEGDLEGEDSSYGP